MTTALIAAVATLLGVLVGAAVRYIVEFRLEGAKHRIDAKVAARLVREDFLDAKSYLDDYRTKDEFLAEHLGDIESPGPMFRDTPSEGVRAITLEAWGESRAPLARVLPPEEWIAVTRAVRRVGDWNKSLAGPIYPVYHARWAAGISEALAVGSDALVKTADVAP